MSEFNAEKAKKISKENNSSYITENILELVKESATKGNFSVMVRNYGFGESSLYSPNPLPTKLQIVLNDLKKLGFKAEIKVEERQFVDIYLLVSWND